MAAKKRKNTERSDDDDSDFETRPNVAQSKSQKKQSQSSKSRSKSQHSVPLPSDSPTLSLENEKQSRRGGAITATEANGQEKENRKGTVEMVRGKKSFLEVEDRTINTAQWAISSNRLSYFLSLLIDLETSKALYVLGLFTEH